MYICHWSNWGVRIAGMYESTKDQIKYERKEGIRSEHADSARPNPPKENVDGWHKPITWDEAMDADIWVLHSKIPNELKEFSKTKKRVAILHGQTEHLMIGDWQNRNMDFNNHINILWEFDKTVCIFLSDYKILKFYDVKGDRLHYIPHSIDLDRLKNVTPWEYDYRPAIISCDTPRAEKLPQHIIWAMPYVVEKIPNARLNLFGLLMEPIELWRTIFCRSRARCTERVCENIQLANRNLAPFQAGADIGFNNNYSGVHSRVVMEMMAQGVPVVSYGGSYTKYHAQTFDIESIAEQIVKCWEDLTADGSTLKQDTIKYARKHFDRSKEVKKYIKLYKSLLTRG